MKKLNIFAFLTCMFLILFVKSGLIVISIALLTLSLKSIKAALADPIENLRYE